MLEFLDSILFVSRLSLWAHLLNQLANSNPLRSFLVITLAHSISWISIYGSRKWRLVLLNFFLFYFCWDPRTMIRSTLITLPIYDLFNLFSLQRLLSPPKHSGIPNVNDLKKSDDQTVVKLSPCSSLTSRRKKAEDKRVTSSSASPISVSNKTWLNEERVRSAMKRVFGRDFPKLRPSFLKNPATGKRLELDGFSDGLAFEYNGIQHYKYTPIFHSSEADFSSQVARDRLKQNLCSSKGVVLLTVPYTVDTRTNDHVDSHLQHLANIAVQQGLLDPTCWKATSIQARRVELEDETATS